ncbi:nucleoside triphosphate pyrophosphohydrolase [Pseudomonas savastanoi]|uniref:nucleoside triphosphate pyrophosphohydrolase n=1 Tax=Pseudomonas savastanoi TaxID=29438 RepID=UPI0005CB0F51|nr:nucleoside triphosphate pyrophosphohydrolase [Pseudomonas savastanoi]
MYTVQDLLNLMARLRDPQSGCPWDLKQTYASIVPHTLEEAYEVADAIEQVNQRWDEIKAEERAEKSGAPEQLSLLDDVPVALPALSRAAKLQKRASQVGFDWPAALPVVDKVREELDEILEAMVDNDAEGIAEEVGDLLFSVVNLARHLKVDPETALRSANSKFDRRFRFIEQALRHIQRPIEACSLEEMDALWGEAKRQEKSTPGCG